MSESVIGIIPAAGKGVRLGLPYPKELLPLSYKGQHVLTVIETSLLQLANAHIKDAVIVINSNKEIIQDYLGDYKYGIYLHYVTQETKKSKEGLTDAIAATYSITSKYDICVMLMPDVYFSGYMVTKELLEKILQTPQAGVALSYWETNEPERFGVVEVIRDHVAIVRDKPTDLYSALFWGAVAFRKQFWDFIFSEEETLSHALDRAIASGLLISASKAYGEYYDTGTPQSLIQAIKRVNP